MPIHILLQHYVSSLYAAGQPDAGLWLAAIAIGTTAAIAEWVYRSAQSRTRAVPITNNKEERHGQQL